eukprot:2543362-Prymnesium_polylepis.1
MPNESRQCRRRCTHASWLHERREQHKKKLRKRQSTAQFAASTGVTIVHRWQSWRATHKGCALVAAGAYYVACHCMTCPQNTESGLSGGTDWGEGRIYNCARDEGRGLGRGSRKEAG